MSSISAGNGDLFGRDSFVPMPVAEVPGKLPELMPTGSEVRMALDFPGDSELLQEWIGTAGGRIVMDQVVEGEHANDPTWRQGSVVDVDGNVTKRFEFRATPPGWASKSFFAALGWVAGTKMQPRGFMGGRIVPGES
ncbi:MAG TPA: hypothetical protein VF466_04390 [Candidatus Saccharimonadales bacterium]